MSRKFFPQDHLKRWFYLHRRQLPWRDHPSPYEVWMSEVMLQQTQVRVVIPYFRKWLELFPSIAALASAPIDKVIKAWEGLGYYSRARNLHEGARYLVKHHQGKLPADREALKKIKGLGPYTIGAILSFAFQQRAPAVDGNVLRTLARYFCIEEEIDKSSTRKLIEEKVLDCLPTHEPWIVMEALIELGALICQKRPKCEECPLEKGCRARQQGKEKELPRKGQKRATTHLHRLVAVIQSKEAILIKKGAKGKVMADLWEFPYFELGKKEERLQVLCDMVQTSFQMELSYLRPLPEIVHGFTRYRAFLYPHLWVAHTRGSVEGYEWVSHRKLHALPFSSGHRRVLSHLEK